MLAMSPDLPGVATTLKSVTLLEEDFILEAKVLDAKKLLDRTVLMLLEATTLDICEFTDDCKIELTFDEAIEAAELSKTDEYTNALMLGTVLDEGVIISRD